MDWEKGDTKKGYFVIRNAQGDITGLYHREDSSLAGSYTYDAWGQLLSVNPANESDEEILRKNPFRYRGYYYDEESGYYFLQSRYYNPEVRRFLNADTLVAETGNGVGYNLFAYSSNQPVNYKDESGHVLDTVMDVVSIGIDVVEIAQNPTDPVSWICLGADVACAVIPVATGGGLAVRAAGKVDDAVDAAKTADHVGDAVKSGTGTKDIYRAVSPEEFDDIFATGGFRARPDGRSFQAKEFGNSFDETLEFANKPINLDKAAIVKVTIPENVYNQLHHMNLDRAIFKSGTPVVEPEMLDMFNESIISIEHAF